MRAEFLGPLVLFVLGSITVIVSSKMPIGTMRAPGSGMFPLVLGATLMALSATALLRAWIKAEEKEIKDSHFPRKGGKVTLAFLVMVLGSMVMGPIGYPFAAFFLVLGLAKILGVRGWTVPIIFSVASAGGSYLVFVLWLKVPLPKGLLGL